MKRTILNGTLGRFWLRRGDRQRGGHRQRRRDACIWAQAMLAPGNVIVDCETTALDGLIVELAAIDAGTGEVLVDSLINPGRPVTAEAQAIHGICDLPALLDVTRHGRVVAYNASFDRGRLIEHCTNEGLDPAHLADPDRWQCAMQQRSNLVGQTQWIALDGGHRALNDCYAVHQLLNTMANHDSYDRAVAR